MGVAGLAQSSGYTESSFLVPIRTRVVSRSGPGPLFFRPEAGMTDLRSDIQNQLAELDSRIELIAVERHGGEVLRIYIDHPDGVDLLLCERASAQLGHLLTEYSLEVSSPGPKFRRPSHLSESKELS